MCGSFRPGSTAWESNVSTLDSALSSNTWTFNCATSHLTMFGLIDFVADTSSGESGDSMMMIFLAIAGVILIIALIVIFKPKK